ncbi:MAG: hypothetical protein K5905_09900 [Roseibium sp.]|uniref:hypothetical protein n=1 Tax=Roseibium sp. TaxID=1936156 RepID=UPI00260FE2D3|nr:hypothetical protein [Roseibium sp.]MCV0425776.1 hypothetical protein [Roseibium sp.]
MKSSRLSISLLLVPDGFQFHVPPAALIAFQNLFGIAVVFEEAALPIPDGLERHVVRCFPKQGPFENQQRRQDQALIEFHQKLQGVQNLICFWNANTGIYRIVFSVPMRAAPKLNVTFRDKSIWAELLPPTKAVTQTAELRFKAVGKSGVLKTPQAIESITLDAEL